jgi:hypothetical protein
MKKIFAVISVSIILLVISGVFAESSLSSDSENFIKNINGEIKENITSVKKIDFKDAPEQVDIKSVDKTHLSMYELTLNKDNSTPVFMITFSEEYIPKTEPVYFARMMLNFGFDGEINESRYLKTASGINGELNKGYIMTRKGSITGISTNLEVADAESLGKAEIIIYRNGREIGFRNIFSTSSSGIKKDYDIQSKEIITFNPGDVISVYARLAGESTIKDVITGVEITTD